MNTLEPLPFVFPEDKQYLKAENAELSKIVSSLRKMKLIDNSDADKLSQQISAGDILNIPPVGKNSPERVFRALKTAVGNTPQPTTIIEGNNQITIKDETQNPFGSHYDRIYLHLFQSFLESDKSDKDILEISSGNAALSCTVIGKLFGKKVQVVIPTTSYRIRQTLVQRLGAKVIPTDQTQGLDGANSVLIDLLHDNSSKGKPSWFLNHSHRDDVLEPMSDIAREVGNIDYFFSAMGNGTSLRGIGRSLKKPVRVMGVRYTPESETNEMLMPGGDEVSISFPHLESFSTHEIVWIPYQRIIDNYVSSGLGLTSYMVKAAVQEYIKKSEVQLSHFLILNYDHINRYAQ